MEQYRLFTARKYGIELAYLITNASRRALLVLENGIRMPPSATTAVWVKIRNSA